MQQITIKPKFDLLIQDYTKRTNEKLKYLFTQNKITKLFIIALLLWNIVLSILSYQPNNAQIPNNKVNEEIIHLEEIPTEYLK